MEIAVSALQGKYSGLRAAGRYLNLLGRELLTYWSGRWGRIACSRWARWAGGRGVHARRVLDNLDGEDGKLVTFELDEKTAGVAKENIAHAGLADRVEVVVGPAEKSLAAMTGAAEEGTYDFAFIDAFVVNNVTHIVNNVAHMKERKRLVKSGGVIIVGTASSRTASSTPSLRFPHKLVPPTDTLPPAALKAAGEETSYIEAGRELLEYLQVYVQETSHPVCVQETSHPVYVQETSHPVSLSSSLPQTIR
ncbi:S-adenosyl-L-methionine-dependent methyltransferase [Schizophyllum commune]